MVLLMVELLVKVQLLLINSCCCCLGLWLLKVKLLLMVVVVDEVRGGVDVDYVVDCVVGGVRVVDGCC